MSALNMLMSAAGAGGAADKLYVDDVFSTYPYAGNNSTQTIVNGIDLAKYGGLTWTKGRSNADDHCLADTTRGVRNTIKTNTSGGSTAINSVLAFNSDGFTAGNNSNVNGSAHTYVSWTFRRAPKFFDIVSYTGNGVAGREIPHGLGVAPGMITSKSTNTTDNWNVYHRSATGDLVLNSTAAQTGSRTLITAATESTFTVSGAANTNGVQYVAYLFAHDPSADGLIQCGSYVGTSNEQLINLGRESQFVIIKRVSSTGPWLMADTMRGMPISGQFQDIEAQSSAAEATYSAAILPDAMGFRVTSSQTTVNAAGSTYIYLAIRRPNKPPTSGTEVYNSLAGTYTQPQMLSQGFPIDLAVVSSRVGDSTHFMLDRLRGGHSYLLTRTNNSEATNASRLYLRFDMQNSTSVDNLFGGAYPGVNHFFRRAPGFFDVVCYMGNNVAGRQIPHGLGVAPELMIVKSRTITATWVVYHKDVGTNAWLVLNTTESASDWTGSEAWGGVPPALDVFTLGSAANIVNNTTSSYVAYLFATLPGISKVGSYTGNGSSQNIECGFATGARFILIKRTDSTGDWYVWDSARGILAANDPHLSLNTMADEVTTDDSVDPYAPGFAVNQNAATNINVNGASYIFLSIA